MGAKLSASSQKNKSTPLKPGFRQSAIPAVLFVVLLWCIKIAEVQFNTSFHQLGVYPGRMEALWGVLTAPLIHGSFEHLAGNSMSLLILISALFYGYPNSRLKTSIIIWLGSGIGTWLFAREAWHFGASGLTHGLFFFLLLVSVFRRDKRSIALMMIAFFMYGGMLMSIFPQQQNISFEYHLFGAIFGLISAVMFRNADPKLQEQTYSWEHEESEHEESEHEESDHQGSYDTTNKPASDLIDDRLQFEESARKTTEFEKADFEKAVLKKH